MAKLFLNLRNVPGDEADDVRDLLRANAIDFYETQPSPWGISAGGLWIEDVDQLTRAKAPGIAAHRHDKAAIEFARRLRGQRTVKCCLHHLAMADRQVDAVQHRGAVEGLDNVGKFKRGQWGYLGNGAGYLTPALAMPVVMYFCRKAKTRVIGIRVITVMASR